MSYLLDTSVVRGFVDRTARHKTPRLVQHVESIIASDGVRLSVVSVFEMERGLKRMELRGQGAGWRRSFTMFMSTAQVYGMDADGSRAWDIAADIHARAMNAQSSITLPDADLLIFATARANDLTLLTADANFAALIGKLGLADHLELLPVE